MTSGKALSLGQGLAVQDSVNSGSRMLTGREPWGALPAKIWQVQMLEILDPAPEARK